MARAWLSTFGIPANAPKDAVYPVWLTDAEGKPLDASKDNYVIHFASKDDLPPADGLWSLTMYDSGYFFVPNPLNRSTLSMRNELKANADGSIDLYPRKAIPARTGNRTGFPLRTAHSSRCSIWTGRRRIRRLFWTAHGWPPVIQKS